MTLDEVTTELREAVEKFDAAYRAKHAENPEHYPLDLPPNNEGLWYEFFIDFVLNGNI